MMLAQYNESRKFMWKSIVAIVALVSALAAFATGCEVHHVGGDGGLTGRRFCMVWDCCLWAAVPFCALWGWYSWGGLDIGIGGRGVFTF